MLCPQLWLGRRAVALLSCADALSRSKQQADDCGQPGGAVAVLHLDELSYGGDGPGVATGAESSDGKPATGPTLHKTVSFTGLTLDLQPLPAAPDGAEAAAGRASQSALADAAAAASQGDASLQPAGGAQAAPDSGWSMRVSTSSLEGSAAARPEQPSAAVSSAGDSAGAGDPVDGVSSSLNVSSASPSSPSEQRQLSSVTAVVSGEGGAGLSGHLELRLTRPAAVGGGSSGPRAAAQLHLEPMRCQLRQRHLPLLSSAAAALAAALALRPELPQPARQDLAACAAIGVHA
jgi:hypothetical protein